MDIREPTEVTPLLGQPTSSTSQHSSVDSERQCSEGGIFHQIPDIQITTRNPQFYQRSFVNRSSNDAQALVTLAADKKISDPRRAFCLLVTFDVILTGILWLIEVGSSSNNDKKRKFFEILQQQVTAYSVQASLFDIVMLSCVRFLFLIFWYALFRIRHWWPVAVSTALSDVALISKIILIFLDFGVKDVQALDVSTTVVCILTNFVLTWVEVWFMDFKVLPAEKKLAKRTTQEFLEQSFRSSATLDENMAERGSLFDYRPHSHFDSRSFYTPAATPAPSEGGLIMREPLHGSAPGRCCFPTQLSPEEARIVQLGKEGLDKLWEMYQNSERWSVDKVVDNGDVVYAGESPEYGKSFKIESHIAGISTDVIFSEILLQPEELPLWNKTVADVKMLKRIGDHTSVSLEISAPAAMGLISSREFVTVRRIEKRGNMFVCAGISTDYCDDLVPKSDFIRGVNGPSGFVVYPDPSDNNSSKFIWILNTDLKGSLSRALVNRNLTRTLIDFVAAMKARLEVV